MFHVVKKAKLSPAEFGHIVGVSRIAAYNWITGRTSPHTLIETRVKRALTLLRLLLEKDKLPLNAEIDRETRRMKITKIKEILDSHKPA